MKEMDAIKAACDSETDMYFCLGNDAYKINGKKEYNEILIFADIRCSRKSRSSTLPLLCNELFHSP